MPGLNQEIWTDVLVEQFSRGEEASFLNEIPDMSRYVMNGQKDNDIIHLVDVGADPEVVINNTTYPISVVNQNDGDIPISLDKFQTEVTAVSDDEIQYIAYDKIRLVQRKHLRAVMRKKFSKAAHALAPQADTAKTPVIGTSGAGMAGRKKMTFADLVTLKRKFDDQELDEDGRVIVLATDHYNDLLVDPDAKNLFQGQYFDEKTGMLSTQLAGFKVYKYVATPYFNSTDNTKLGFGAVPSGTHYKASVAFLAEDMFRATGRTKNYEEEPKPRNQQWEYNIRHNYIALPRKQRAIGAIVSQTV